MILALALLLGNDTPTGGKAAKGNPLPSMLNPEFVRPADAQSLNPAMMRGLEFLRRGQPDVALEQFFIAHNSDPENPRFKSLVGIAHLHLNDCEEGQSWLMPLRAIRNFRSASADKLAACWARQGEFAEAVFWQEESIWLEPDRAVSWALLGLYLMRLGDPINSQMALAEAEFLDQQVLRTEMVRAMQALSVGDIEAVDEQLRVLRGMPSPGTIVADELEARLELDLGNVAEAARLAVRSQSGAQRIGGLTVQAEANRRGAHLDEAWWLLSQRDFEAMAVPDVHVILARVQADRGEFASAQRLADALLAADGWNPDHVATAWYVAQARGRDAEAEALAQRYEQVQASALRPLSALLPQ